MWGLMILSYLCIAINIFLLALTGLQGYFQFQLIQANHPQFALFTAIFFCNSFILLTTSMSVVVFIIAFIFNPLLTRLYQTSVKM